MLYQNCLQTNENEDRKYFTRVNGEVKIEVPKSKSEMWKRKCAYLDCYM